MDVMSQQPFKKKKVKTVKTSEKEKEKDKEDGKTGVTEEEYIKKVKENMMAVLRIKKSDNEKYAKLKLSIRDQLAFGIDV